MRCASCGGENPAGAKFCIECAAPFTRRCPSCDSENLPRAKFCAECATPLATPSSIQSLEFRVPPPQGPDTRPETLDPRPSEAERRQLTVMFCDLSRS